MNTHFDQIIHIDEKCSIFFGNASSCDIGHKTAGFKPFWQQLRHRLDLKKLIALHQVHSKDGQHIDHSNVPKSNETIFEQKGDWLSTSLQKVGICILTADCLPIVLYSPSHNIVSIIHAGWKGSIVKIAPFTIKQLMKYHKVDPSELLVFFGPAAQSCCYEIQPSFLKNLESFPYKNKLILARNNKLFFDNSLFNQIQLIEAGIKPENINRTHNHCTICNPQYHSYRRRSNPKNYKTQQTIVWLENKKL